MPIYAYRCSACGHQHDALQKMSDPPLVECPACHAPALQKQVTAAGFQLKGSGWYVTDFKNKDSQPKPDKAPAAGGDAAAAPAQGSEAAAPSAGATTPAAAPAAAPGPAAPGGTPPASGAGSSGH